MASSALPPALWVLPASLLAAAIAGACLGQREQKPPSEPPPVQQPQAEATPAH